MVNRQGMMGATAGGNQPYHDTAQGVLGKEVKKAFSSAGIGRTMIGVASSRMAAWLDC